MNIIQLIRLILKHLTIVLIVPIIMVVIVILLTRHMPKSYSSKTVIYTGIGTGYNLQSVKNANFDFMKNKTAFDNLINIIEARKTVEEVSLRLLAQHMAIKENSGNLINNEHFLKVQKEVFDSLPTIDRSQSYENIYQQLVDLLNCENNNFLYHLIHSQYPYYSLDAVSKFSVKRISNSDLIEINFESDDAGICQQTLVLLNDVFIRNYKQLKKGETSNVVEYFEKQLAVVKQKLNLAEVSLLNFNKNNHIINYYEQTKHISKFREDIDLLYQQELMQSAAAKASVTKIEEQLNRRNKTLLKSGKVINLRKKLSDITTRIVLLEVKKDSLVEHTKELNALYTLSANIKQELNNTIDQIGIVENTTAGLSQQELMTKWLEQIINYEESNARIGIYQDKINKLKQTYAEYAPLGATMMRIERQISVTEREYLAILKGLNDSKIMQRNIEMSTNLNIMDAPFYPVIPKPSKRKMFIASAGLVGFIITVFLLIVFEYFDSSIKNQKKLAKITSLPIAGAYPNLRNKNKKIDFEYVKQRSIDAVAQQIRQKAFGFESKPKYKPFISVVFGTNKGDGKTVIAKNLYNVYRESGFNVAFFNYQVEGKRSKYDIEGGSHYYNFEDLLAYDFEVEKFFETLLEDDFKKFDFIFIEIPSVLHYPTPVRLLRNVHFALMVARANRSWSEAETNVLNKFKETVVEQTETEVLANGVEIDVLESIIGEIPKKRSFLRRMVKRIIKFQFTAAKHI